MTVLTGIPIRRIAVGCVIVTALGLGACTGAGNSGQDSTTALETLSASISGDDSTSTNAGITPLGDSDTAMKTLRPEAPATLVVTDVRVGSHEGFDRVVFDLTGEGTPGWFIDYTDRPSQQGSGRPVDFRGATALNVNLDGMAYPFDLGIDDPQIGTVEGVGNITEVQSIGTFEGRSQFIIGMNQQLPYSVQVLDDPPRVVVDIVQR
ncbi:AMIN-like domain-containing (lipo)protein [Corynebacterium sp. A21]|uniref:AMIN-like domain-containing (lipo)protein n=1 Tax=Corynebacterium sp. A21 TaxID=3457318 RepID=UPI003FD0E206